MTLSRRRHFHRVSLPRAPAHQPAGPRTIPAGHQKRAIKRAAMRDCGRRCVYCARRSSSISRRSTTCIRSSHGGAHAPGNVVLACARCNRLKGDLLPTEFFARYPWAGLNFIATRARCIARSSDARGGRSASRTRRRSSSRAKRVRTSAPVGSRRAMRSFVAALLRMQRAQ